MMINNHCDLWGENINWKFLCAWVKRSTVMMCDLIFMDINMMMQSILRKPNDSSSLSEI